MPGPSDTIRTLPDSQALAETAARDWIEQARRAIDEHGTFRVALSGGTTPRQLFEVLARDHRDAIDWGRLLFFFGDERCVPSNHPDSNYRMARETLFTPLGIPDDNIVRVHTELGHEAAAVDYDVRIRKAIPTIVDPNGRGLDLAMLGLGPDGHTASLFPDTPILEIRDRVAADVYVDRFDSWRISMTYPVFENASAIMLLVAGEAKQAILEEIFTRRPDEPPRYPIERLRPRGQMSWYLDEAAAARLQDRT